MAKRPLQSHYNKRLQSPRQVESSVIRLEGARNMATTMNKAWDIPATIQRKLQESDFSLEGKDRLRQMFSKTSVAHIKNDCGDLGMMCILLKVECTHQYPLNLGAVEEMDKIVRELSALSII